MSTKWTENALIKFDDGDFEMVRLSELKYLMRLCGKVEGANVSVEEGSKKRGIGEAENLHICIEKERREATLKSAKKRQRKNKDQQPIELDDEEVWVESGCSGQLYWRRHNDTKEVLVRTKYSGKMIASGIATLPIGRKSLLTKVSKERNGFRHDGKVKGFDPEKSEWKIEFSWGVESWNYSDIESGFILFRSGFFKRNSDGLAYKRCIVQACDKRAQGRRTNHMCQAHFGKLGEKLEKRPSGSRGGGR